jgi:hypothetical protein
MMKTLWERTGELWNNVRRSEAQLPTRIAIPAVQTDKSKGDLFKPNQNYFQVRVNEMFLQYGREWFSTYLPMILFISEFSYGRQREVVPFVVGPTMLEENGRALPDQGLLITNTRVAGVHPYRGGRLTMTAVLYRAKQTDYARNLLNVVENAAGLLDFSTSLGVYTKVASVILDGLEALFKVSDTDPVVGWRQEFDPDAGDEVIPGYFALINKPDVDRAKLWVKDNQLCYGDTLQSAQPYRAADFLLYSLAQTTERSDVSALPFQELAERVLKDAAEPTEAHWKSAKANMLSLYQTLNSSPDLTEEHARQLADGFMKKMKERHETAVALDQMESGANRLRERTGEEKQHDAMVNEAVSILDL